MSQMLPPQLAGPMQGGGLSQMLQGAPPDADEGTATKDPLSTLQDVIEEFPPLLHALQGAEDVNDAVSALRILTGIQKRLMASSGAPAQGQ